MLVILDKKFFQVLEGPGTALNALYEKIMWDLRHKNPKLLSYIEVLILIRTS
ncbi:MAG: BLUF domain-containing protein [Gammaproteobacteria bacterium]|nr:BLUF domain-containing protein [Gammaproteobacteria bacterium]